MTPGAYMAVQAPLLVLAVAGMVLAFVFHRRLGGAATTLLGTSCVTFLLTVVIEVWWVSYYVRTVPARIAHHDYSLAEFTRLGIIITVATAALTGASFALLVIAVLVRRPAPAPNPGLPGAAAPPWVGQHH